MPFKEDRNVSLNWRFLACNDLPLKKEIENMNYTLQQKDDIIGLICGTLILMICKV